MSLLGVVCDWWPLQWKRGWTKIDVFRFLWLIASASSGAGLDISLAPSNGRLPTRHRTWWIRTVKVRQLGLGFFKPHHQTVRFLPFHEVLVDLPTLRMVNLNTHRGSFDSRGEICKLRSSSMCSIIVRSNKPNVLELAVISGILRVSQDDNRKPFKTLPDICWIIQVS